MTIDDAFDKINAAARGNAQNIADNVIARLSADDRELSEGYLQEMAITIDQDD